MNAASLTVAAFLAMPLLGVGAEEGTIAGTRPSSNLAGKLLLTGSTTMAPLMTEIGKRFRALHRGVEIEVLTGDQDVGLPTPERARLISGWLLAR